MTTEQRNSYTNKRGEITMKNIDLFHVSFLSEIAGEITCLAEEGLNGEGHMLSWSQKTEAHYWLTYDNSFDKPKVIIAENYAPSKEMYAVIGYCSYHEIDLQIDDRVHDDDTPPANVVPL